MQLWPNQIVASGYVAVPAGAPILVGSNGPVESVTDQGTGHFRVNLRSPGIPGMVSPVGTARGATLIVTPVDTVFSDATCTAVDNETVDVFLFDATGAARDGSFCFLFLQHEVSRAP